jgi:hypothetical protein
MNREILDEFDNNLRKAIQEWDRSGPNARGPCSFTVDFFQGLLEMSKELERLQARVDELEKQG